MLSSSNMTSITHRISYLLILQCLNLLTGRRYRHNASFGLSKRKLFPPSLHLAKPICYRLNAEWAILRILV